MTNPKFFGLLFFVTIVVFGGLYYVNASSFNGIGSLGEALYFSIVTITTLGFGDVAPSDGTGRLLVCLEAVVGVIIVGLFLNAISARQAAKVHQKEVELEHNRRFIDMRGKLRQNYLLLSSLIERYLESAYFVTTPKNNRALPDNILNHQFDFSFNDLADLYEPSQSFTHQFNTPAINIYFDMESQLYDELRKTISDIDLSYWPDIDEAVHVFLESCRNFPFKNSILNNIKLVPAGQPELAMKIILPKLIRDHRGPLNVNSEDVKFPYVELYKLLQAIIPAVQVISKQMGLKSVEQQM